MRTATATTATGTTRAAVYCRISSDDERDELGVKRQEKACRDYVERQGWTLAGVYTDNNRSASKAVTHRPEFDRLLADVVAGRIDRVVVVKQDRLLRKPGELEMVMEVLRRYGVDRIDTPAGPVELTSTQGRAMARVSSVFDILYAEVISEKVKAKKLELAERGLPAGGGSRPYGYAVDKVTVIDAEAAHVREAVERLIAGDSLTGIAADWNARGVHTVTGSTWNANTLRGLVTAPRIAGLRAHKGEIMGEAVWPALVDVDQWRQVCAVIDARRNSERTAPDAHLLTGLLFCGRPGCGGQLYSGSNNGQRAYVCMKRPGKHGCGRLTIVAEPLEAMTVEAVLLKLDSPTARAALVAGGDSDAAALVAALAEMQSRLDELAVMFADGEIDRAGMKVARGRILDQIAAVKADYRRTQRSPVLDRISTADDVRQVFGDLSRVEQREVLAAVVNRIVVAPGVRGRRGFDPLRVNFDFAG